MRQKYFITILLLLFIFSGLTVKAHAAPVFDMALGVYHDDFADNTGVPTLSNTNADVDGRLKLTKSGNNYNTSGYAITQVIKPPLIAKWGTITLQAQIPAHTSVKVQILDDNNGVFPDSYLPGNSSGIESQTIDIGNIPVLNCATYGSCNKPYSIKIKFILASSDVSITPTVDSLNVTWTLKQGDLSVSSGLANAPWPAYFVDQKGTLHSPYQNPQIYPAIKWAGIRYLQRPFTGPLYVLNDKILGSSQSENSIMFTTNRDTGQQLWKIPFSTGSGARGVISNNGTFYGTDIGNDGFYTIDTNTGQLKWLYDFNGGHGNSQTVLGNDGTIYTLREQNLHSNGQSSDSDTINLYAFNSDGSIKFTKDYTISNGYYRSPSSMAIGSDQTIYFGTYTLDINQQPTDNGKLYAINPSDGSVKWEYPTGTLSILPPLIDDAGTIFVVKHGVSFEKKIFAIHPDGTLKWEKSIGTDPSYYTSLSLRSDGVLLTLRGDDSGIYKLEAVKTSDGTLLWSRQSTGYNLSFTDSNNGVVYIDTTQGTTANNWYTRVNYYDADDNFKWKIAYPYNSLDGINSVSYRLSNIVQDERGWMYGFFGKSYYDANYQAISDQMYTRSFAMTPWTLASTLGASNYRPGDTITFTVSSSMQQTNPLFGGDNKIQVLMDNGDKVVLTHNGTAWTGSYTLPPATTSGSHNYTVEASQSYLQTDIPTHFDAPSTESNNTGIIYSGNFTIGAVFLPGDLDQNGKVDIFDYNYLVQNFGRTRAQGFVPSTIDPDIVKNDVVDIFDYNILVQNFGRTQ